MNERIREILSWYESDTPGTRANLVRMLAHGTLGGTGKMVILPVDQGFEHGPARSFAPNPDGYDPRYHFQLAVDAGCNAYAAPLGFLEAGAAEYAGQVPLILKLNNSDSLSKLGGAPISAVTASVKDAVRLGCVAIGYTIYPASDARNEQLQNLRELTLMVANGMSPSDVLVATTRNAAELLGLLDELGTIEPGKRADLVVVEDDPFEFGDLGERIRAVYQDGRQVSRGPEGAA